MRIKVCGLTREEDVRLACRLGAWAVGFVFAPLSPRRVDLKQAARLRAAVAPGVLSVGVFEDGLTPEIEAAVAACRLDAVQLHGAIAITDEYVVGHYLKRIIAIDRMFGDTGEALDRYHELSEGQGARSS